MRKTATKYFHQGRQFKTASHDAPYLEYKSDRHLEHRRKEVEAYKAARRSQIVEDLIRRSRQKHSS